MHWRAKRECAGDIALIQVEAEVKLLRLVVDYCINGVSLVLQSWLMDISGNCTGCHDDDDDMTSGVSNKENVMSVKAIWSRSTARYEYRTELRSTKTGVAIETNNKRQDTKG